MIADYITIARTTLIMLGNAASRNGVAGGEIIRAPIRRVRACDRFVAGNCARFCVCGFANHAHSRAARYAGDFCSECGERFDRSYSLCDEHGKGAA